MASPSLVFCDRPEDLAQILTACLPRPAAIVGIGNPLRGDDGFGPAVVSALRPSPALRVFNVQEVPESFLVPIAASGCPGILFVDAAELKAAPGRVALAAAEDIPQVHVSTHAVALSVAAAAIRGLARETSGSDVVCALLAAQPADLQKIDGLSPAVVRAVQLARDGIEAYARGALAAAQPRIP